MHRKCVAKLRFHCDKMTPNGMHIIGFCIRVISPCSELLYEFLKSRLSVIINVAWRGGGRGGAGTSGESALEVRKWQCFHWAAEFKSFPTVYDTPMLLLYYSYIGMPYTIGKLLTPAFQCLELRKRVAMHILLASMGQRFECKHFDGDGGGAKFQCNPAGLTHGKLVGN